MELEGGKKRHEQCFFDEELSRLKTHVLTLRRRSTFPSLSMCGSSRLFALFWSSLLSSGPWFSISIFTKHRLWHWTDVIYPPHLRRLWCLPRRCFSSVTRAYVFLLSVEKLDLGRKAFSTKPPTATITEHCEAPSSQVWAVRTERVQGFFSDMITFGTTRYINTW